MIISIIISALILSAYSSTPCTPKYLLPQTIHDSITIQSFNTSNSLTQSVYTYNYFQTLFTGTPTIILSINGLIANQFSLLNYQLSVQIQTNSLSFYFKSQGMAWTSLQVQFLLHSRSDIYSNIETISILQQQKNTTVLYQIPNGNLTSSYIFANFIIGIVAPSSNNYSIYVNSFSVSQSQYEIVSWCNVQAALTIQTVYIKSQKTSFSYSFDEITFTSSPHYRSVWADFAPNIYTLFGFSMMKVLGNALSVTSSFDLVANLLTIDKMTGISTATVTYFAIGQMPINVCSPCNNFISISGCLDVCPNNSYAQSLSQGGKTCRFCNSNLGQTLNSLSNSCDCSDGLSYRSGNCYKVGQLPPSCNQDQVLISNKCVDIKSSKVCTKPNQVYDSKAQSCQCIAGFQKILDQCIQICPSNSKRESSGLCKCSLGFLMNNQQKCQSICPLNSYYDAKSSSCFCNANYQMNNGVCVSCSSAQSYDSQSRACVAKTQTKAGIVTAVSINCLPNQVVVEDTCQCDSNSIKINNKCVQCPASTYKPNSISRQCVNCMLYCSACQNSTSCNQCSAGFKVNGHNCSQICGDGRRFILPCDDGNTFNGDGCSQTCQIQSGYICKGGNSTNLDICSKINPNAKLSIAITPYSPTFVSSGIITDFTLNPPIQRTRQQLHKIFTITFTNHLAKPKQLILSQSDKDLSSIRCFFSYHSDLPNSIFQATFLVNDDLYGHDSITILYNSFTNPVKSSIQFIQSSADILH